MWFAELRAVITALSPAWLSIPAAPPAPVASAALRSGSCTWCTPSSLPSPPFLLAVSSLDSGAGSDEELVKREQGEEREAGLSLDSPRSAQPAWGGSSAGQDWFWFFLKLPEIPARSKYRGHWKTSLKQQMSVFPLSLLHQLRVSLGFHFLAFRAKLS